MTTLESKPIAPPAAPARGRRRGKRSLLRNKWLYLMLVPGLIHLVVFKIAPVAALVIAFKNFSPFLGLWGSPWVGLQQFQAIFNDPQIPGLVVNTLILAVGTLIFSFPAPIIFALFLNEVRFTVARKFIQTMSFVPYLISSAVLVSILYTLLSPQGGLVNEIIKDFGGQPISFLTDPDWFRPLYIGLNVWQTFGYGTIIYLAAMTAIDPSLYEAAEMDGVGRFGKMRYVTLPALVPMMVVMLILALGQVLTVDVDKILLMYNPNTYATADVLQTYVYRLAFASEGFPKYSYAAAVSLLQGIVAFVLVLGTNRITKRLTGSGLF
ncbi:ABC transporter permease [Pseudarthrobacter sp. NPDC055928]|uniref:ABC transporter permease n=1 Tax=Pseudarthrobacter sp. NPDC055928 TaxID=3345661 RepID=UPI0035E23F41